MKNTKTLEFWSQWGLIPRLMLAVGIAIAVGGGVQTFLLVAEGATESTARLRRDASETITFMAPLIADQALVGEYAAIEQLLKNQVKKGEIQSFIWTDKEGRRLVATDDTDVLSAPQWFTAFAAIDRVEASTDVTAGGVSYGQLNVAMTQIKAHNRLWHQFVKQLQILAATLFLMLQFIWLIFRGNLGTLRMLATSANRFSQGDRAVRIVPQGAPEVRLAAEAFNNMANNTESLLTSLSESESKSRLLVTIVEQSSEAIWTADLDGKITSWNSGAAAMFGYPPAEAIGKPLTVAQKSVAEQALHHQRLMAGERFSYDAKALTKSGAELDIQVALAPLVNEASQSIGSISVARDITQNKRSEEVLRQAREAAEAANRAKSSFLARMSHEIRTPMNGVLGMTELLLETGLTGTQRKYAETVQRSGTSLLGIINDVLDFSKIEAGKLEIEHVDTNLRVVIEDTVELLAERAHAKGLELACRIASDVPKKVLGDPLRLGQVMTNLASNAIKFTQSGSVVISVSKVDESTTHLTARFEVEDTGAGISPEAQTRIFEEFSQADGSTTRKHGGSGLGLAISKQLVEMMGGELRVESTVGSGSRFWFTCRMEKPPGTSIIEDTPLGALTGGRALIVEASAINRGILRSQITDWGMNVRMAETPDHALQLLTQASTRGAPFDLAIIDLGLPGTDSIELARKIRTAGGAGSIRLVMLAPVGSHSLVKEARLAGFNACLIKPVRQSALYECLVGVMAGQSDLSSGTQPTPALPTELLPHTPSTPSASILLAEDNLINQAVAMGILNQAGRYEVVVANNGREALDALAARSFDLVLMDCHMPDMDGFEATIAIRKREALAGTARTPIVAVTANAMEQDRQDCLNAGMDDHLSKPFSRRQLQAVLDQWLPAKLVPTPHIDRQPKVSDKSAEAAVLDQEVLKQLASLQTSEDPGLLSRVIQLFLTETPKLVEKLARSSEAGDTLEATRAAHTIKSSSSNVGAALVSLHSAQIEAAARRGEIDMVRASLATLEKEFAAASQALEAELAQLELARSA